MAENIPSMPGGAVPPKPPEGVKPQAKKETVRINLPPKPSAAPTIKLPTLPPGGPTAPPTSLSTAPSTANRIVTAPAAPTTAAAAQRPAPRPAAPIAKAPVIGPIDTGLAIAAAVAGLLAVASAVYCMTLFK